MLYPDFHDLLSYKEHKFDKLQLARRKVSALTPGQHHSPFRGQGLDFDAVREYVPGDDIRNIDWRVTARTGSPHLKLFKEEKERHSVICVDMNASMRFGTKNTFKSIQAARCASFLGWRALAHHDRLSVCLFGDVEEGLYQITSKHARQTLGKMLKCLTDPPKEQPFISLQSALLHINRIAHPGSLIYVISDFMDIPEDLSTDRALSHLSHHCDVVFVSINDAADSALVPSGVVGFRHESDTSYIDTDHAKGRKLYTDQWQANRQALNKLTERFKLSWIALTTESTIHRDLLVGLKNIARRKR